ARGGAAEAVRGDVTVDDDVAAAVSRAVERFERLDVLVNNVGIAGGEAFADLDHDEWMRQTDPTLWGAMRCIQACLPHLLRRPDGGAVVSISSVNGLAAVGGVAYSAAKAGLINASANLAVEYGTAARRRLDPRAAGVRFNVVAPGTIRTRVWDHRDEALERFRRLYPAGRVGEPEDIAAAVAFLASDEAEWITGITLPVDGGLTTGPLHSISRLKDPR
ncbi:MAG: SDR family NAD(P)-dependent oxidoreductase, partial [Stackebrandtia sp.]